MIDENENLGIIPKNNLDTVDQSPLPSEERLIEAKKVLELIYSSGIEKVTPEIVTLAGNPELLSAFSIVGEDILKRKGKWDQYIKMQRVHKNLGNLQAILCLTYDDVSEIPFASKVNHFQVMLTEGGPYTFPTFHEHFSMPLVDSQYAYTGLIFSDENEKVARGTSNGIIEPETFLHFWKGMRFSAGNLLRWDNNEIVRANNLP